MINEKTKYDTKIRTCRSCQHNKVCLYRSKVSEVERLLNVVIENCKFYLGINTTDKAQLSDSINKPNNATVKQSQSFKEQTEKKAPDIRQCDFCNAHTSSLTVCCVCGKSFCGACGSIENIEGVVKPICDVCSKEIFADFDSKFNGVVIDNDDSTSLL